MNDELQDSATPLEIEVDGARISGQTFPRLAGRRDVVLLHGAAAHRHWWDLMLGTITRHWNVTSFDLSGHGDSAHRRDGYSPGTWAKETAAVIAATSLTGSSTVIAHSMGGLVALDAAALYPAAVDEIVILDTLIRRPLPESADTPRGIPPIPSRIRPDRETALRSFRLMPKGGELAPDTLRRLAEHSFRQTGEGWRPKFDHRIFQQFTDAMILELLQQVTCRITLVGGGLNSSVSEANARFIAQTTGRPVAWGNVPGAHHHVQLDQPEALAALLVASLGADDRLVDGLALARP